MINLNKIKLDFEPRRKALESLPPPPISGAVPHMSEFESAFLCGLIKKFEPKKILEVGVASGGTTAIMLQCLEDIGQKYKMYSIDAAEPFYGDHSRKSGFLAEPIIKSLNIGEHKFYLGTVLPFVIDEIGNDIDFVILDTIHMLPGEVLDFLAVLPYLKENAVVCLHDVSLTQDNIITIDGKLINFIKEEGHFNDNATAVLLSAVTADKYLNLVIDNEFKLIYPNIAAFQVNSDTMKYIENVFLSLVLRWTYLPNLQQLKSYMEIYSRYYPQELINIFQETVRMNLTNIFKAIEKQKS